jgi:hypothetical protein
VEYVAVVSHHGKPQAVHIFASADEARNFAVELSARESWDDRSRPGEAHGDHEHESHWLEDWGDQDGCGVVAGALPEDHDHGHDH